MRGDYKMEEWVSDLKQAKVRSKERNRKSKDFQYYPKKSSGNKYPKGYIIAKKRKNLGFYVEEAKSKDTKRWRKVNVGPKFATKKQAIDIAKGMRKLHSKKGFYYRVKPWKR